MGFWAVAIPAIATLASSLLGKKEGGGETISQQMIYDWTSKYLPQYTPGQQYAGQLTAGKTPQETTSLGLLDQYLASPALGATGTAAQQQIMNTLSGQYMDPQTSPYIQSMQKMSQRNLEDAISRSRLGQGSRGKFYSTAGLQEEGRLTGATQDFLNTLIGQFIESERGRQYGAVTPAMAMEEYQGKTVPLSKIGAGQTYGALDRTLEQSNLEAQYQEWTRARGEMSTLPGLAAGVGAGAQWGIPSWQMPTTTSNNMFGNIISALMQPSPTGQDNTMLGQILGGLFKKS